ncbi:hypothetical protein BJ322DRAFT_1025417 [Thelephora terrestris]|uniref:Uncharacterized protein n=1 Tax=Thelephora terrestris TaxID=56493 RepID=A0A9P6L1I0_9AGAM|nr:hypothetical protein BJ322DRAFT_1025417 [Thelephora terrestris]
MELLSRGVEFVTETNKTYNSILEARINHTGNIGTMLMDEIAHVNERIDSRREEIENVEKDVSKLQEWTMLTDDATEKQAADIDLLKGEMVTSKDLVRGLIAQTKRLDDDRVCLTRRVSELTGEVRDFQRRCQGEEVCVEEEEPMIPEQAESPPARGLTPLITVTDTTLPWNQWPALEFDLYAKFVLDSEPNSDMELPDYEDLLDVDPNKIREQNWANEELPESLLVFRRQQRASGLIVNKFKTYPPLCPQFYQWKTWWSMWWAQLVQFVKEPLGFVKEVPCGKTDELVQKKFKTYPLIKVWAKWWVSKGLPPVTSGLFGVS